MFGGRRLRYFVSALYLGFSHTKQNVVKNVQNSGNIFYFQDLARFDRRRVYFFAFSRNNGIVIFVVVHQFSAMIIKTIKSSVILWNS